MRKHEPTDVNRRFIKELVILGRDQERIAEVVGVSLPTLHRYYRKELDRAKDDVDAAATRTMVQMMTGGGAGFDKDGRPEGDWRQANATMLIFYAKTRMGFRVDDGFGDEYDNQGHRVIRVINSPEQSRLAPPRPASQQGNGADHDSDDLDLIN